MTQYPMSGLKETLAEAIGWLEQALEIATEEPEATAAWPALAATAEKIEAVLEQARGLFPLHPEIEAAIEGEDDDHETPTL